METYTLIQHQPIAPQPDELLTPDTLGAVGLLIFFTFFVWLIS